MTDPNPEREDAVERGAKALDAEIERRIKIGIYGKHDLGGLVRVVLDACQSAREDEREWILEATPGYGTVLRAVAGSEVEPHENVTVVPKSALLAAEQRAGEAEKERDEANEIIGQSAKTREQDLRRVHFKEVDEQRARAETAQAERDDYKARVELKRRR